MYKHFTFVCFVAGCGLWLSACGDLSDTCITNKQYKICYSEDENTRFPANRMLEYLPTAYPKLTTNFKIYQNPNDSFDYTVLMETSPSVSSDKQKLFLQKMADSLSVNCFEQKKVRVVAVTDIDATTKGNLSVVSQ